MQTDVIYIFTVPCSGLAVTYACNFDKWYFARPRVTDLFGPAVRFSRSDSITIGSSENGASPRTRKSYTTVWVALLTSFMA